MNSSQDIGSWRLVQSEIGHRWPSMPIDPSSELNTPEALAAALVEHMGFSRNRAFREASEFLEHLKERFHRAV